MAPTEHWLLNHWRIINSLSVEFLYLFCLFLHRRESPSTLLSFCYARILSSKAFLTYCPEIASSNFWFSMSVHFIFLLLPFFTCTSSKEFSFSSILTFSCSSQPILLLISVLLIIFIMLFCLFFLILYYSLATSCITMVSKIQGP